MSVSLELLSYPQQEQIIEILNNYSKNKVTLLFKEQFIEDKVKIALRNGQAVLCNEEELICANNKNGLLDVLIELKNRPVFFDANNVQYPQILLMFTYLPRFSKIIARKIKEMVQDNQIQKSSIMDMLMHGKYKQHLTELLEYIG